MGGPIAFIATAGSRQAAGGTAEVYRYMAPVDGHAMLAKVVQLFKLRPGSMRRTIEVPRLL